ISDDETGLPDLVERGVSGIEIEMEVIRTIDVVTFRVPLIQVDASKVDDPHERRQIADDGKIDDVAVAMIDRAKTDPFGPRARCPFHEEEISGGAVRISL